MILLQLLEMRRFVRIVALFALLCVLSINSLEGRIRTELLSNEVNQESVSTKIEEYMAKWLLINCKVNLMDWDMKGSLEGVSLCHSEEMPICAMTSNTVKHSLAKSNIQKAISFLPPKMKQSLVDCLTKQNIVFHIFADTDGSKSWYADYLEYLLRWPDAPRRYLRDELSGIAATPGPSPGVSPPSYGPAPFTDPAPASSEAPTQLLDKAPPPLAEAPRLFIPRSSDSSAEPPAGERNSGSPDLAVPVPSSPRGKNRSKSVVIAVVVTAGATFLVAALLFCCYRKYQKKSSPTNGPKDDSPLLSISLSDYSGSSHKSSAIENSISKDKFETLPFNTSSHNIRPSALKKSMSTLSDIGKVSQTGPSLSGATLGSKPSTESPAGSDNTAPVTPLPPLKPPPGRAGPPPPMPPPPPVSSGIKPAPRPPPPPMGNAPPRPPQPFSVKSKMTKPSPLGPNHPESSSTGGEASESEAPKTKLKPFFWDKVLANPDQSMVWHQIKSGSFQFNEEMIETLFGYNNVEKNKTQRKKDSISQDPALQYIQIIDSKKAQNLSILLRALNLTTAEVCDALYEGNELPLELCQTLLKMAPSAEEELKLRLYNDELSQLGPAERFLKVLVNIPFAFKRLDSLCFMISYQEEVSSVKESLATLEVACKELRNSRLFLKLLEAVLKTGNRMNDGTFRGGAQAFKLDTLLKLADVKGIDGKTTLLHFVVQEIIRSEGVRAARAARENQSLSSVKSEDLFEESLHDTEEHYRSLGLQVISHLGGELENVKKASVLDADGLSGTVAKLGHSLGKNREFLNSDMKSLEEDSGFHRTLQSFVQNAEVDISWLLEEEKRIMALVRSTADYFHGSAKKDEGLRLFVIVRNFLVMIEKTCKEVKDSAIRPARTPRTRESPSVPSSPDMRERLFPAIMDRRMDNSSSDDEGS
ncbi:hypothetical protein AQUCO_00500417v1 [Aquilegia coerulea]|uniref:Formin-like protein n=1 Tax=Aquilegia coerulea TaxID=218851 RepID=A0A2G5ERU8_AQUCA|nr:hypothetical protein AQUCO_00500417v1 [Aquilegia coerulea]